MLSLHSIVVKEKAGWKVINITKTSNFSSHHCVQTNDKLSRRQRKRGLASDVDVMAPTRKSPRKTPIKAALKTFTPSIKKMKGAAPVTVNITPTSNYYAPLQNNGGDVVVTKEKKLRIPPITMVDISRNDLHVSMTKLKIENYDTKLLKYGIQIFCKSTEDFNTVNAALIEGKQQFYTHDLPSNQLYKVVLRGLHQVDPAELSAELKLQNVTPESIKIITPKNVRYASHVNYILYFKEGEVKLNDLRKNVRSLFHTIVTWEAYRSHRTGPTQCTRCQRPGHGARHCNMSPRCEFCAEGHESKTCPRFEEIQRKAQEASTSGGSSIDVIVAAKCCNCNENGHFSSDPGCPKKKIYAERRMKRSTNTKKSRQPVAQFTREDFPVLYDDAPTSKSQVSAGSYAQQVKIPLQKSNPSARLSAFAHNHGSGNLNKIEAPFSFEEMMAMTSDVLNSLRSVKTASREYVIMTVMQISIKYLFNDGSK